MKLKDYLKKALEISVKLDEIEGDLCSLANCDRSRLSDEYGYLEWICNGEPDDAGIKEILDGCGSEAAILIRDSLFIPKLNELRALLNSDLTKKVK